MKIQVGEQYESGAVVKKGTWFFVRTLYKSALTRAHKDIHVMNHPTIDMFRVVDQSLEIEFLKGRG